MKFFHYLYTTRNPAVKKTALSSLSSVPPNCSSNPEKLLTVLRGLVGGGLSRQLVQLARGHAWIYYIEHASGGSSSSGSNGSKSSMIIKTIRALCSSRRWVGSRACVGQEQRAAKVSTRFNQRCESSRTPAPVAKR